MNTNQYRDSSFVDGQESALGYAHPESGKGELFAAWMIRELRIFAVQGV